MKDISIREMTIEDYKDAYNLWANTSGIGLGKSDSEESINSFLTNNPGLSFVAHDANKLIGTILCSCDGRRGYIYHLAIHKDYRKMRVGSNLVSIVMDILRKAGIHKCHIFVYKDNKEAMYFWERCGFSKRHDIHILSSQLPAT